MSHTTRGELWHFIAGCCLAKPFLRLSPVHITRQEDHVVFSVLLYEVIEPFLHLIAHLLLKWVSGLTLDLKASQYEGHIRIMVLFQLAVQP